MQSHTAFEMAMQSLAALAPDSQEVAGAMAAVARAAPALVPSCTRAAISPPPVLTRAGRHRTATKPPRSTGAPFRVSAPLSAASGEPVGRLDLYCADRQIRDDVSSDLDRLYRSEPAAPDTRDSAPVTAAFVDAVAAALATRALMDHATEVLTQRGGCTESAAFARLQSWSRLAGISLTEAAARVVDQPD